MPQFLQSLMEFTAGGQVSVIMSSHLMADLERVCDYLIVLVASRVRVAGEVEELLATHHLLTGPRRDPAAWPSGWQVISASHTDRQTTLLVRTGGPIQDPGWAVEQVGLEDLVLAYMSHAPDAAPHGAPRVPCPSPRAGRSPAARARMRAVTSAST
jgi:ABC-2 type transport system ATP-binding protein